MRGTISRPGLIVGVAACAAAIGAVLPWFHVSAPLVGVVTINGIEGDGRFVLPLAALLALAAYFFTTGQRWKVARRLMLVLALTVAALMGLEIVAGIDRIGRAQFALRDNPLASALSMTFGIGLYLSAIAALIAALAAGAALQSSPANDLPSRLGSPQTLRTVNLAVIAVAVAATLFGGFYPSSASGGGSAGGQVLQTMTDAATKIVDGARAELQRWTTRFTAETSVASAPPAVATASVPPPSVPATPTSLRADANGAVRYPDGLLIHVLRLQDQATGTRTPQPGTRFVTAYVRIDNRTSQPLRNFFLDGRDPSGTHLREGLGAGRGDELLLTGQIEPGSFREGTVQFQLSLEHRSFTVVFHRFQGLAAEWVL